MKNLFYNIAIIILLGLIAYLLYINKFGNKSASVSSTDTTNFKTALDVINARKSVRHFTDKIVSKEDLVTIVKAGMAAPTAVNKQPWHFIIINERKTLNDLSLGLPNAQMIKQATAAIIVCGNLHKALPDEASEYWIQDCSAATENMLLAVEAMGLGAVWTGVYPNKERIGFIKSFFKLPDYIIPLNVIPIGYPTGEDKPKNKFKEENISWNKFNI